MLCEALRHWFVLCIDFIRCGSLMSTSIVAFLLLTKFRAVSAVVNCVTFDCGIVTGSYIITTGSWVQVDGRGSWEQRKVGIICIMRKLLSKTFWKTVWILWVSRVSGETCFELYDSIGQYFTITRWWTENSAYPKTAHCHWSNPPLKSVYTGFPSRIHYRWVCVSTVSGNVTVTLLLYSLLC